MIARFELTLAEVLEALQNSGAIPSLPDASLARPQISYCADGDRGESVVVTIFTGEHA